MGAKWRQTLYKDFDPEGMVNGILWRGINEAQGWYVWYCFDNNASLDSWVMTGQGPVLKVADGSTINDSTGDAAENDPWYSYNGHRYWQLQDGNYVWFSTEKSGWLISSKLGACIEEYWDSDQGKYLGNAWWGPAVSLENTYPARGCNRGTTSGDYEGTPKTVALTYSGYKREDDSGEAPAGKYKEFTRELDASITIPSDPTIGEMGLPQWSDQDDKVYIRSLDKDFNEQYSYGPIYYDGEGWVIGIRKSREGWWEGDEPSRNSDVTFTAMKITSEDDVVEDDNTDDITVSYDKLVVGKQFVNTFTDRSILAAQIGMWL